MTDALPPGKWIPRGPIKTFRPSPPSPNLERARRHQEVTIAQILRRSLRALRKAA